jgi:tetratricopeptide (TPR) repeat protein
MSLPAGAQLGPYEVVDLIGRGGMGEVYRARDHRLGRDVAIKILPTHLAAHAESLARFRREGRAVAALSHRNIVAVFDIGSDDDGRPFVVTELLDGETLRLRLERGRLSVGEALRIGGEVAEGLAAAHAKGIIHRDLKPENVFLTRDGGVKILDFGLAAMQKPLDGGMVDTEALTEPGLVIGTIGYMSPEQLRGRALTTASDVFSFGCLLYELLNGEMPFRRESNIDVIASVLRDDPFRGEAAALPAEIHDLLARCLEKEPSRRLQNGAEVAAAMREVMARHESGHLSTMRTRRVAALVSPRATLVMLMILLLAAAAGIVAWMVGDRRAVIDGGYDIRAGDVTANGESKRLLALALRADADGNRSEAIELSTEAARLDAHAPLPAAFAAWFLYYEGDEREGLRWSAEAQRRLPHASSTYESLLCRYLRPANDGAQAMALASSLLELRPKAWRLRLSLAHRHLDRREMPAMLAQLQLIDVEGPDDRRLAVVLADRGSLGDLPGALRDLQRSRLMSRPALLAYTRGRFAWTRHDYAEAAKQFDEAAERATRANLISIAADSSVLAGAARAAAGELEGAQAALDLAALRARQSSQPQSEVEANGFGAYVAFRRGDMEGVRRRLRLAAARAPAGSSAYAELRLFDLRTRASSGIAAVPLQDEGENLHGAGTLLAAREAWWRGDVTTATRLLAQARSEGIDSTWFSEEAALLATDLGAAPRLFSCDPPYPNRLRLTAAWELARVRGTVAAPSASRR